MSQIAVIYWSGTGNTKAMAEAVAAGAGADIFEVSQISAKDAAGYDKLALGCPAMGAEVLEESEFEPFYQDLKGSLSGKKVALFGSYGWGDGTWMRDWVRNAQAAGADVFQGEGLIINETPDAAGLDACKAFGEGLASA